MRKYDIHPLYFLLKRLFIVLNYSLNNKYKNQKKK